MQTFGRRIITSPLEEINRGNLVEVLNLALSVHKANEREITYLYEYYRGKQPILERVKTVRPEINNKIVENRAFEIVAFKTGYVFGEPVQYVRRGEEEETSKRINLLNEYMFAEDKATRDKEVAEWFYICGTAYRMVLPDSQLGQLAPDESPFEIDTLDPRNTFVVYNNGFGKRPLMGVTCATQEDSSIIYSVYTSDRYYRVKNGEILEESPHSLGEIPIIEYPANSARLGSFEVVLTLLDALNNSTSNRMDGIEQFVQAFMKFINCDIDEETFRELKELGAIKIKGEPGMNTDVDIVSSELNQTQVQVTKEDLYQSILTICGMPDRNGANRTTGDTGQAVILRDGWSAAEARARDTELMFKKSEKRFLKLVLKIVKTAKDLSLNLSDIDVKFNRRQSDNLLVKTQGLQNMLEAGIDPLTAITTCGLFSDATDVYATSAPYLEKWLTVKATVTPGNNKPNPEAGGGV